MRESVLITGSGNGLGRILALKFAEHNYNVIINARKESELGGVSKEIERKGVSCYTVQGDLGYSATLERLTDVAKEHNIEVLINNGAALCPGVDFDKIDENKIYDLINVNLVAPIQLTRSIYPLLQEKRSGTIININSVISLEPKKLRTVSSAAKAGLRAFTDCLRLEAEEYNIHVVGIHPTRIKTKPEYNYGMNAEEVATKIYEASKNRDIQNLILEGRPIKYRPKDQTKYLEIEMRNEE